MKWLLLFLCLSASAQPFNAATGLPFLAPNAVTSVVVTNWAPTNIASGLSYWWVSSDVPTNTAVLSWTDRVQQLVWTNGNAATRPTNSSSGVHFVRASSTILTNNPAMLITIGANNDVNTHFVILNQGSHVAEMMLGITGVETPCERFGSGGNICYFQSPSDICCNFGNLVGTLGDLCVSAFSQGGHVNPSFTFYTNAVPCNTNSAPGVSSQGSWNSVGGDAGTGFFDAFVKEVIIYTNTLTLLQVSNVHYYATNTYHYAP